MNGLHWYHVGWIALAIYVIIATASASNRYELNHFLAEDVWRGMSNGYPRLLSFQDKKAEEINKFSKERWQPKPPNSEGCAYVPEEISFITKAKVTELNLSLPKSRNDVVQLIGKPYCELLDGDRWVLSNGAFVDVQYNPVRIRYSPDSTKDASN